ncbi:type 1 fimbrial protein [Xenorhabdus nematophila]|uniref:type 1 fimbrial protein n=1 Tax=Xenorhabdus nematophila TaxID=628 RepID=UPI0003A54CF8|nr:type 1 fimbrial protein [Xenorhabdus nematophila]
MKTKLLILAVFMAALTPTLLLSTAQANSGTISFSGAIVSPPCEVKSKDDENTEVHCFTASKRITKIIKPKTLKEEPISNLSSVSAKHISKNMTILIINHH